MKVRGIIAGVAALLLALGATGQSPTTCSACLLGMRATLLDVQLITSTNTMVDVLAEPRAILLPSNDGLPTALLQVAPATGATFTGVQLSFSDVTFLALVPGGGFASGSTTPSAFTVTVELDDEITLASGQSATLEIKFDPVASFAGSGCDGVLLEPEFDADLSLQPEDQEFTGIVVSVASPNFVMNAAGVDLTIATNAQTMFTGVTGVSGLAAGMVVEVEAQPQTDGSWLAREVEREFDFTGRIVGVTPVSGNAAAVDFLLASSTPDNDLAMFHFVANISSSTKFKVNKSGIKDTLGLVFNRSNLSAGQRVTVNGPLVMGAEGPEINATRLTLKIQEVDGKFVADSISGGDFQLELTSPSRCVFGVPILIRTDSRTKFSGGIRGLGDLNTIDTYKVQGLLFRNGSDAGDVILLAKKVQRDNSSN